MNFAQEIERLTKPHAEGVLTAEEFTKAKSQLLSIPAFSKFPVKGIRRQSPNGNSPERKGFFDIVGALFSWRVELCKGFKGLRYRGSALIFGEIIP